MILVDTSVWIDLLGKARKFRFEPEQWLQVATCNIVVQEVLQGISNDLAARRIQESLLALPRLSDPTPIELHLEAAEIYRRGRQKGYTIRSAADCLIASVAIRNQIPVLHQDRDFEVIARYTGLQTRTTF